MRGPCIFGLLELAAAVLVQLVLKHERHHARHLHLVLFGVRETGDRRIFDEERAVRELDLSEGGGAVADSRDDFIGVFEFADNFVRGGVGRKVEHGCIHNQRKSVSKSREQD